MNTAAYVLTTTEILASQLLTRFDAVAALKDGKTAPSVLAELMRAANGEDWSHIVKNMSGQEKKAVVKVALDTACGSAKVEPFDWTILDGVIDMYVRISKGTFDLHAGAKLAVEVVDPSRNWWCC